MSLRACGEIAASKNRVHRPGGDRESSPGDGRGVLQGPWGGSIVQELDTPAWVDRESSPGGGRSVVYGPQGRGYPPSRGAAGSRVQWAVGVVRRVCGGQLPVRLGRTGSGGQGVVPRGWAGCRAGPVGRQ